MHVYVCIRMSVTVSYRLLACGLEIASVALPMANDAPHVFIVCCLLDSGCEQFFVAVVSSAIDCCWSVMPFSAHVPIKIPPFHGGC